MIHIRFYYIILQSKSKYFSLFFQLCDLYGCQLSEWVPTCKQFGGPVNVNLEACIQQDSGCEAFKRGHCNFKEETILANIAGNFRAEDCQVTI